MDCKSNINLIKQETQDSQFSFDIRVKVENDIAWPIQSVLNDWYQDNKIYQQLEENNSQNCETTLCNGVILTPNNNLIDRTSVPENSNVKDWSNYRRLKDYCMICGNYFFDRNSFLQHNLMHLKVIVIKKNIYICDHCKKYYERKKNLKNHILINHIKQYQSKIPITKQKYKCLICERTYSYKAWLGHKKEVHGEANLKCKECNLSFKCQRYFDRHIIKIHTKVNQMNVCNDHKQIKVKINCHMCPAVLNSAYALTTHIRNCHSKKSYTCHICKSTLKCKSYLLGHMRRVHYNDGILHDCKICGKEFKSTRYLKIHIKNSHT